MDVAFRSYLNRQNVNVCRVLAAPFRLSSAQRVSNTNSLNFGALSILFGEARPPTYGGKALLIPKKRRTGGGNIKASRVIQFFKVFFVGDTSLISRSFLINFKLTSLSLRLSFIIRIRERSVDEVDLYKGH